MSVPAVSVVRGLVLQLAKDGQGCRLLQAALDEGDSSMRRSLVSEFRGHVLDALESPHANHVLQRAVELMPPASTSFILDEFAVNWDMSYVVRHKFGCRLLERIFEHFTACPCTNVALEFFLSNGAFGDISEHCSHMFGTHVMQHLMEYGTYEQQCLVSRALWCDLRKSALDEYAVGVLDKALTFLPHKDQQALASAIVELDHLLPRMAMSWRGQPAAERLVRIAEGSLLKKATRQLAEHDQALKRSKGGRALLAIVARKSESSCI